MSVQDHYHPRTRVPIEYLSLIRTHVPASLLVLWAGAGLHFNQILPIHLHPGVGLHLLPPAAALLLHLLVVIPPGLLYQGGAVVFSLFPQTGRRPLVARPVREGLNLQMSCEILSLVTASLLTLISSTWSGSSIEFPFLEK